MTAYFKRILCIITVFTLLLSFFPTADFSVKAADSIGIELYQAPTGSYTKGSTVTVKFNVSGATEGTAQVKLDASSGFSFANGIFLQDQNIDSDNKLSLSLKYNGGDNPVLKFTLTQEANTGSFNGMIPISELKLPDPEDPEPLGEPTLGLTTNIPTLKASETQKQNLKFTFTNTSTSLNAYGARASITGISEGGEDLLRMNSSSELFSTIAAVLYNGGSGTASYNLTVPQTIKSGYYTLTITTDVANKDGTRFKKDFTAKIYIDNPVPVVDPDKVKIIMKDFNLSSSSINAGDSFKLNIDLENIGNKSANNIEVSLSGFTNETIFTSKVPFEIIDTMKTDSVQTVSFDLKASPNMPTGIAEITASIKYSDQDGTAQTITVPISIPVTGAGKALAEISSVSTDKSIYEPGDTAIVSVTVKNIGESNITNTKLHIEGFAGNTAVLKSGIKSNTSIRSIGTLKPGQSNTQKFTVDISKRITADMISLKTTLSYLDSAKTSVSSESTAYIFISLPKESSGSDGKTSTPRVIIEKYHTDVQPVQAGKSFVFNFTLKNTSEKTSVGNMKITVSSEDGTFFPTQGSDTFFVEKLGANQSTNLSLEMSTKNDAATKSYPITITIDYEDGKANPYNSTEKINIALLQPQLLEIKNVSIPTYSEVGMPVNIMFEYINKGKTPLLNLNFKLEGDFTSDQQEVFVGNLDSGLMSNYDNNIYPNASGPLEGKIIASYEDAAGNVSSQEIPIVLEVSEPMPVDPDIPVGGGDIEPAPEGMSVWTIVLIAAGAVIIIGGGIFTAVIIKKRKAKKGMTDDEED